MDRWNSEAMPRDQIAYALTRRDWVRVAVRTDACLICKGPKVNEAGICSVCVATLTDVEIQLVEKWMSGVGP